MYDFLDRRVAHLDEGGRFLVWSMRVWVKVMGEGRCPFTVIAPAFARWKMIGGLPHFHRAMSEAFFVLSGTVRLYDGTDWVDGGPNDFLYVPPGGIHGFRNEADDRASLLMLFAPGAPREHYFEGLAQLGDLTDDERRQWFIANDNFVVD